MMILCERALAHRQTRVKAEQFDQVPVVLLAKGREDLDALGSPRLFMSQGLIAVQCFTPKLRGRGASDLLARSVLRRLEGGGRSVGYALEARSGQQSEGHH